VLTAFVTPTRLMFTLATFYDHPPRLLHHDDTTPLVAEGPPLPIAVRPVHRPHQRPADDHIARYVRARHPEPDGQLDARLSGGGTGREDHTEPSQQQHAFHGYLLVAEPLMEAACQAGMTFNALQAG
jgi:hypothetical protein